MAEPEADPKPQLQPQDSNPYMHYLHGKKLRPDMVEALTGPLVRPFDETKTYFPVFANVMVPEDVQQYLRALNAYAQMWGADLLPILANGEVEDLESALALQRAASGREYIEKAYFKGSDVDNFLGYVVRYLRPADDESNGGEHFSMFSFAIINENSFEPVYPHGPFITLCTEVPDQKDDLSNILPPDPQPKDWKPRWPKRKVRMHRKSLAMAPGALLEWDSLTATFTEVVEKREHHVSMMPPAFLAGSIAQAKQMKWMALACEQLGEVEAAKQKSAQESKQGPEQDSKQAS